MNPQMMQNQNFNMNMQNQNNMNFQRNQMNQNNFGNQQGMNPGMGNNNNNFN